MNTNNRVETDDVRDELSPATSRWLDFITTPTHGSAMIYGPTQMGKTAAAHIFVRKCLDAGVPVVISTDNRTDQLDQFYSRFRDAFAVDTTTTILRVADRQFERQTVSVLRGNRRLIIFLLNNASQVDNLRNAFREAIIADNPIDNVRIPKVVILHDEGDVVTKDANVKTVETGQTASHQAWLRVVDLLGSRSVLKRAFLTATPENVVYLHDIERVIRLPIPTTGYIGWQNIQFVPLPDDVDEAPLRALVSEVHRIERGSVLFCVERVIEDGHDELFQRLCREVKPPGVVHTYNGRGIMVRCTHPMFLSMVRSVQKETGHKLKIETLIAHKHVYRIVGMPIAHFYEVCRRLECFKVVTIGMDLMSRGISFVSSGRDVHDTIAATTMIYTPGATMHAVGLVQAIGRITGKACPELERRLYAPQRVIENYLHMMVGQQEYLKKIEETKNSREDMTKVYHRYRLSVSLDRIRLGLRPLYAKRCFKVNVQTHNAWAQKKTRETKKTLEGNTSKNKIDGVDIVWLKGELKKTGTLMRRIIKELKKHEVSITISALKTKINLTKEEENDFHEYLDKRSNTKNAYGKIWIIEGDEADDTKQTIMLNPKIRTHI